MPGYHYKYSFRLNNELQDNINNLNKELNNLQEKNNLLSKQIEELNQQITENNKQNELKASELVSIKISN